MPPDHTSGCGLVQLILERVQREAIVCFVICRRCDQQQTGSPNLLRLNHRERDDLDFPRRDDAVRETELRQGLAD
jgi:hypothetical protein